jgi:hypothetical protein
VQDNAGNFYASDTNYNIRKIAPDGTISTFAGTGVAGATIAGSTGTLASFNTPNHLSYDSVNEVIYVAVTNPSIVALFTGNASTKIVFANAGLARGIAVDASGTVYATMSGVHGVYRFLAPLSDASNKTLILGSGLVSGNTNGVGLAAQFNSPVGLSIASQPTTDQAMSQAAASAAAPLAAAAIAVAANAACAAGAAGAAGARRACFAARAARAAAVPAAAASAAAGRRPGHVHAVC